MKATTALSRLSLSVLCPLICGFICIFLAASGASAGDPDDDWGLPSVTDEDNGPSGDSDSAGNGVTEVQIGTDVTESETEDEMGQLIVDVEGEPDTGYTENVDPAEAHVVVPGSSGEEASVPVQLLDDGLALQGRFSLKLPYMGDGALRAMLKSPVDAVSVKALFTVDDLDSIEELLADPSGAPAGVSTLLPVGGVAVVDLNAFQKLVDTYGHLLTSGSISVVVLSTDSYGGLHVSAARMAATGGTMEILIR